MTADDLVEEVTHEEPSDDESELPDSDEWVDVFEPARWRTVLSLIISLGGLGVATYLTVLHYSGKSPAGCPTHGSVITCNAVLTSAESNFLGIPVALLGLVFYVGMTILNLPVMWRSTVRLVHLIRLGAISAGMAFALYLVSAELLVVGHICEYCTSVHILTFFLFVLIVTTVPTMLGWGQATPINENAEDEAD